MYSLNLAYEVYHDSKEILEYISKDSVSRANQFIEELEKNMLQLKDNPLMCPYSNIAELAEIGIRVKVYFKYLIFYSVSQENERVNILRIRNGSTNYVKYLNEFYNVN